MIMIQGPPIPDILTTFQNTLKTIQDWCRKHRLAISKDNSAMMPMYIRNREQYRQHPPIVAGGISVVSKMRYIGIILDSKLNWYPQTQYMESKLLRIQNSLVH
jgi:hypothetical protein